ncbi:MAG: NAD(P)-binding protein [Oligoflexales bacterium]
MDSKIQKWDIIIAGGGISGTLAAKRLCEQYPKKNILLIERETQLGGSYRSTSTDHWGGPLAFMPHDLFQTLLQGFAAPESQHTTQLSSIHHISGGQKTVLNSCQFEQIATWLPVVGKSLQGEWDQLKKGLYDSIAEKSLQKQMTLPKKGSGAAVLDFLGPLCGLTDPWGSSPLCLRERLRSFREPLQYIHWSSFLEKQLHTCTNLSIHKKSLIVHCEKADTWMLHTSHGLQETPYMVIAQNPWTTLSWLPEPLWPSNILNYTLKTRPTSRISISSRVQNPESLPQRAFSAAESTLMEVHDKIATWSIPMDYEISLEAPKAVKSVARVKRGSKKILKHFEDVVLEDEHIALQPTAWGFPKLPKEHILAERHLKKTAFPDIAFCGRAYGFSQQEGQHLIDSLMSATTQISELSEVQNAPRRESPCVENTISAC